jgi:iron complex outermembrane receptor protein
LYGGGAVGGVVNTIDNRIPTAPLQGLSGVVDASIDTSQRGRSGSAVLETSLGKDWALHVDAFKRRSESTSVPVALDCSLNGLAVTQKKVCNTQAQADGGAVGVSRLWSTGFVGLSVDTYRSDYGTPAEDEVTLAMKRTSYTLKGEQRQMSGPFKAIAVHINSTRYAHTELDAGVPATEFNKRGQDAKLTLTHRDTTLAGLGLTGTALLSVDRERFSALGDEAFVPNSQQRQLAIASVQTLKTAWGSLTAGVRVESVNLSSKGGDQTDYSGANKFNVLERRFTPKNLALSSVINVFEKTQLTASVSSNERAPSASELFANGAHVATAAFEIGDANLSKEKSRNLDVGVQWRDGNSSFKLGGFYNRFKNYIGLNNSGTGIGADGNPSTLDADGDGIDDASGESILAQYQYQAVGARFMGLEAQGQMRLIKQPYTLDVTAKFDTLSAVNISNGEPLPRIAPMRLTLAALVKHKGWTWRAEWAHNAKQSKVPENDMQGATPAYNLINLRADYRNPKQANTLWYLSVDNVLNKVAYNAATIDTIRDKAPLAGRRLKLGVQIGF